MSDDFVGKTFKSGNSVALRLPKGLGVPEGTKVRMIKESAMSFRVEPVAMPQRTIDVSGFAGKMPGFAPASRDDFDERPSAAARRKLADHA